MIRTGLVLAICAIAFVAGLRTSSLRAGLIDAGLVWLMDTIERLVLEDPGS